MDAHAIAYDLLENRISAAIASADPALFDALALDVFHFQQAANAAYRQYCQSLGITDPKHWRDIPPVPQAAFKLAALRSFPAEAESSAFHTSGTTGEGYGIHHFLSMRLYDEAIQRAWDLLNLPQLPQIILIPTPSDAPHSSLSHMMGVLKARAKAGEQHWCVTRCNGLDTHRLDTALNNCRASGQPVMLLGTALAFLHWLEPADHALSQLPPGSIVFETGGYKGSGRTLAKSDLYALLSNKLAIDPQDILNEYGMTELSSQCYTRGIGKPHVPPPWMRALVVDPATGCEVPDGETGLLRLHDLANLGSVMAIQTRDFATRRGSHFELLGRDPAALPRGCSRAADEMLTTA